MMTLKLKETAELLDSGGRLIEEFGTLSIDKTTQEGSTIKIEVKNCEHTLYCFLSKEEAMAIESYIDKQQN